MDGQCSTKWEKRNSYMLLVGKPEGKRPLGRPKLRREDNIKMNFDSWRGGGGVMWTGLVWLRIGTGGELLGIRY
jgi:hypothetical protein